MKSRKAQAMGVHLQGQGECTVLNYLDFSSLESSVAGKVGRLAGEQGECWALTGLHWSNTVTNVGAEGAEWMAGVWRELSI